MIEQYWQELVVLIVLGLSVFYLARRRRRRSRQKAVCASCPVVRAVKSPENKA